MSVTAWLDVRGWRERDYASKRLEVSVAFSGHVLPYRGFTDPVYVPTSVYVTDLGIRVTRFCKGDLEIYTFFFRITVSSRIYQILLKKKHIFESTSINK